MPASIKEPKKTQMTEYTNGAVKTTEIKKRQPQRRRHQFDIDRFAARFGWYFQRTFSVTINFQQVCQPEELIFRYKVLKRY